MKNQLMSFLTVLMLACLGAGPMFAQDTQQPAESTPAEKAAPAKPARHAHAEAVAPETLSGTLSMVDADKKLIVVTGSNGVPYDFNVTGATKITVGGNKAKLADLSSDTNKQVSVTFLALKKRGNIAKSVEVTQ